MNKICYILKGTSSSGKSTLATELKGESGIVCCADDYFTDEHGQYHFNASHLGNAHGQCQMKFLSAINSQRSPIIVANTNTKQEDWNFYAVEAQKAGYMVFHLIVEKRHNNTNTHNIPQSVLKNQVANIKNNLKLS